MAALAAVLALAAPMAACGSSGSSADKAGTTTTAQANSDSSGAGTGGTATTTAAATTPAKGSAKVIDVCATVDAAKAAQLSGLAITTAEPLTGLQPKESGCGYSNDDSSVQVQITVFQHNAVNSYDTFSTESKNNTAVSGLGDKAFYDNDQTLYTLSGDTIIQVNGVEGAEKCAALARPVLAAL